MTPLAVSYFLLLLIIIGLLIALGVTIARRIDEDLKKNARLLVIVPQGLINPLKEHRTSEIHVSQELYRRLGELKIPFTLEAEVQGVGEEIHFFITVSKHNKQRVAQLMEMLWPGAAVEEASDYDAWHSGTDEATMVAGYLEQRKPYSIPIELAHRGHYEPFTKALQMMSKLAPLGEAAALQWVVRPANPAVTEDIGSLLTQLAKGHYHISKHLHETFVINPDNLELIKKKISQPLFVVTARVAASSDHSDKSRAVAHGLAKILEGRSSDRLNQLMLTEPKQPAAALAGFLHRSFEPSHSMILSAQELATLFHFPGPTTPVPKIRRK